MLRGRLLKVRHLSNLTIRRPTRGRAAGPLRHDRAHSCLQRCELDGDAWRCLGWVGESSGFCKTRSQDTPCAACRADQLGPSDYCLAHRSYDEWGPRSTSVARRRRSRPPFAHQAAIHLPDPFVSLKSAHDRYDILGEPLTIHQMATTAFGRAMGEQLMEMVGLDRRHSAV